MAAEILLIASRPSLGVILFFQGQFFFFRLSIFTKYLVENMVRSAVLDIAAFIRGQQSVVLAGNGSEILCTKLIKLPLIMDESSTNKSSKNLVISVIQSVVFLMTKNSFISATEKMVVNS